MAGLKKGLVGGGAIIAPIGSPAGSVIDYTGVSASFAAGPLLLCGNSTTQISSSTASTKFFQIYVTNSAASGDNRGMYLRQYLTGGGGGEALRVFSTNNAAAGTVHGAHISLNGTGSTSGQSAALRTTLHLDNKAYTALPGTYSSNITEIWSDGATTDPVGMTQLSFMRFVNGGNASGIADVDDDAFLFTLEGGAIASGNIVEASTTETNYSHSIRVKLHGTTVYLMCASAVG